jgi:hypothetical protein
LSSSLENSLRQNENDLIMAKQSADNIRHKMDKLQIELDREKSMNNALKLEIEQFNLQESLEIKNKNFLKRRNEELQSLLDNATAKHSDNFKIENLEAQLKTNQTRYEAEAAKWSQEKKLLEEKNKQLDNQTNQVFI